MTRNNKQYYYTCCSVINNSLVGETFFVSSREDAYDKYNNKYGVNPSFVDGPFYRKIEKNKKQIDKKKIKLSGKMISGLYKGEIIKGMILSDPENYILLINHKQSNKETNIIHISELKDFK